MFAVALPARWTLNAFAGAYAYGIDRKGVLKSPAEGPYTLLINGLESFAGSMSGLQEGVLDGERRYATDSAGRTYTTILAKGRSVEELDREKETKV